MPKKGFQQKTNTYTTMHAIPVEVDHFRNHPDRVLSLCIASYHLAGAKSAILHSVSPPLSRNPFNAFLPTTLPLAVP